MGLVFENAHCHTYYSNPLTLPDSTVSIESYAKVYKQRGMQCLVMSEHGYRGNVWQQADVAAAMSDDQFKMKPICAAETYFVPDRKVQDPSNYHLLLIAKDNIGFRQLNRILSESQMTGYYKAGRVDFELLSSLDYRHFLCTTACVGGVLKNQEEGERMVCQLAEIFKENFRLEVQWHQMEEQIKHNAKILKLYRQYGWPLFFATDSHYINPEDKILRKELQLSSRINLDDSGWDLYLPTAEEACQYMIKQGVFSKAQIEEAFENTLELRTFEGFSYTTERKLPISIHRQNMTQQERDHLYQKMVCDGYISKAGMPDKKDAAALREEMNTIVNTNSADYFISLKDMLDRGVELGGQLTTTARGSAGSFATNYALGFTSINRLKAPVTMYPERFISADKLKAGNPDIDSNLANVEAFEQAGKEMFGEFGCLPIIAYGKTKVSSAFKLLARARNLEFEVQNEISKQIQNYEMDRKHAEENNLDDPDYDVDDYIKLEDYIEEKYIPLVEESKQYREIITSISPHPCAHITYHKDMREEIGVVRLKAKTGNKEPKLCLYIDGVTADKLNYVKSDMLRVDVVKIIADSFAEAGLSVMPVDELLDKIKDDEKVWSLYWNGYTQGLNQCERPASTKKCMLFKPRNIVELSSFIASIRPGFKSMGQTFWNRQHFVYGIPSLDELLKINGMTGVSGESAFLLFDEQILRLLIAGGIPAAEAYATIKYIKKKKQDKVIAEKEKFKQGFTRYLIEKENSTEALAHDVVEKIWRIIEDSSSYLFCAAHSFAMACDSAYCAWLKAYHPYELYSVMLKLYTKKSNKEKIAAIISEMNRCYGISMSVGCFGQDNRDWYVDKENKTISQNLSSIKFVSQSDADILYSMKDMSFGTFTDCLRYLQMETNIDRRAIEKLVLIDYFRPFGHRKKLCEIMNEFFNGKMRLTKSVKSFEKRLAYMREYENKLEDEDLPIEEIIKNEQELIGLCLTNDNESPDNEYLIEEVDDKYGVNLKLYSVRRGTTGIMRLKKDKFNPDKIKEGNIIYIDQWKRSRKYSFHNGNRVAMQDEYDLWIVDYRGAVL